MDNLEDLIPNNFKESMYNSFGELIKDKRKNNKSEGLKPHQVRRTPGKSWKYKQKNKKQYKEGE